MFQILTGCFYRDFRCPQAAEIHIFCLKSQFLREIPKKPRNPNFRENHMGRPLVSLLILPPPQGKLVVSKAGDDFFQSPLRDGLLILSRSRYTTFLDHLNLIVYQSLSLGWIFTVLES